MKTFKIAILFISILALFSATGFADTGTNAAGASFQIANSNGSSAGGALEFTPSPTTKFAWNTSSTSYAISAVSARTNVDNGKQYGCVASESPIYERAVTSLTNGVPDLNAPTSATSLGTGWADKAGNTAP